MMTMQENCPKDGGNSVLSAPKEKMYKNAEYSRTATSPQISSQFVTRFVGNVVADPFHVLKFQKKNVFSYISMPLPYTCPNPDKMGLGALNNIQNSVFVVVHGLVVSFLHCERGHFEVSLE